MKIIFYNHRLKKVPESWIQQVSFDGLLRQSDVLSLHVIQTPETIDLINNDTIAKMKNGVIILNTARGKLVSEADIRNALNEGKIYAYATDVVKGSPLLVIAHYYRPKIVILLHILLGHHMRQEIGCCI